VARVNPLGVLMRRIGGESWFPPVAKWLMPLDAALQERTHGRIALMALAGLDSLVLTTTGRRSGQPRRVALLCVRSPEGYVVAGSNWGGPRHPAWSANLLAHPAAEIAVSGRTSPVTAVLATGTQRAQLWDLLAASWPPYHAYARRAGREIRVFLLSPAEN
jgi:deazaflavin-dependent oxidoreductase (nitroreductase family)